MKQLIVLCIGLFLAASVAMAGERQEQIDKVLELSGLSRQLGEISAFASHQIQTYGAGLEPKAYEQLQSVISQAFQIERLTAAAKQRYAAGYDAEKVRAWIDILSSPLTKRMFALEAEAGAENKFEEVMAYVAMQDSMPASEQRRSLIDRLDAASKASELALESQLAVLRCVLITGNNALTDNKRLTPKTLDEAVAQARERLTQELVPVARATYLYTYRNVTDGDLEQYVGQYESVAGAWAMDQTQSSIKAALQNATSSVETQAAWQ